MPVPARMSTPAARWRSVDDGSDLLRHPAHQHARLRLDDGHRSAPFRSARGKLEPDEAAADDDEPHAGESSCADGERVVEAPQRNATRPCIRRKRQLPRDGAGRQEKLVIGQRRAVRELDRLSGAVDPNRAPPGQHRNALLGEAARPARSISAPAPPRGAAPPWRAADAHRANAPLRRPASPVPEKPFSRNAKAARAPHSPAPMITIPALLSAAFIPFSDPFAEDSLAPASLVVPLSVARTARTSRAPRRPRTKFRLDSPTLEWNEYSIENLNGIFVLFGRPRQGKPDFTGSGAGHRWRTEPNGRLAFLATGSSGIKWRNRTPTLWRKQQ